MKKNFNLDQDLPLPKMYRVIRNTTKENFGFSLKFSEEIGQFVLDKVDTESFADFAGLKENSHLIEINGLMTHNASREDVQYKFEFADKEVRLLVIDQATSELYKSNNVDLNIRNVEGVTSESCDYRPRLCKIEKSNTGYGFSLLFLEDRKGEFIEDLSPNGSGAQAGLKIGDRVVEVNGVNVERENSREVVSRIRMSGNVVYLLVLDPKADGYFRKKSVTTTASLACDYFNSRTNVSLPATLTPKPKRKVKRDVKPRYCRLIKRTKEEFGLYVVIDNSRIGQVIRWVDCGGAADRAGLRIGDRIVEVNGKNVEYEAHQPLISAICANKNKADLIVVDEEYDGVYTRNKPRLCRLFKEQDAFGFCVEYNNGKEGHYVIEVDPSGPADRAGLSIGDRVIQINGVNVESLANAEIVERLRSCESEVVLLVIDKQSKKHYKQIVQFKSSGLLDVDYDAISIPEEPVFVPTNVGSDDEPQEEPELKIDDSIIFVGAKGYQAGRASTSGQETELEPGTPRKCVLQKENGEDHGFFLAIDRDRNGQVVRKVVTDGAAYRAGLRDGDRVLYVNKNSVESLDHEEVVSLIRESGNRIEFTVLDEQSDSYKLKGCSSLFRLVRESGGYGFYLWYDENGHYVQDVAVDSPADKMGLRQGDRLIEINGVNVEEDSHEDVFYRIKACSNVVTLLALDAKSFAQYKRNSMNLSVKKVGGPSPALKSLHDSSKRVRQEVKLRRGKLDSDYGFHLAYSNSFMGGSESAGGGHIVHWVEQGGPASVAGIRDGDRIVEVNGVNVESEDHESVAIRINANGKNHITLTLEFEEDLQHPHDVVIKRENDSFGFYLWFDDNGHYIEDVTIGLTADLAGLKVGDRLIEVNGTNIENEKHETVVDRVKQSGDPLTLNVVSVHSSHAVESGAAPKTCHIVKQFGSYGFCIREDEQGLYVEFVQENSAAEKAGLNTGDRLIEINGESAKDFSYNQAISLIMRAHFSISLTVLSANKQNVNNSIQRKSDDLSTRPRNNIPAIFDQLLSKEDINYVVEERKYNTSNVNDQEIENDAVKTGTDMRDTEPKRRKSATKSGLSRKSKQRESLRKKSKRSFKKKKASCVKSKYFKGEDNIAFAEDCSSEKYETDDMFEGHFLEHTLKRVETKATARRRPTARRPTIEREEDKERKEATQSRRKFHVATSGTLRWKFDETDSRRPGHVITRRMSESLFDGSGRANEPLTALEQCPEVDEADEIKPEPSDVQQNNALNV